jgi:hypothetical protein
VQLTLKVPDPGRLEGVAVQTIDVDEVVIVMATVPLALLTVQLDVPEAPTFRVKLVGEQASERTACGLTLNVTVTECDAPPLVPVTATWNVPVVVKVHDRVEVPDPVTLVGDSVHEVLLVVKVTTPEKPFSPVIVMVEVAGTLVVAVTVVGLAVIVKS